MFRIFPRRRFGRIDEKFVAKLGRKGLPIARDHPELDGCFDTIREFHEAGLLGFFGFCRLQSQDLTVDRSIPVVTQTGQQCADPVF